MCSRDFSLRSTTRLRFALNDNALFRLYVSKGLHAHRIHHLTVEEVNGTCSIAGIVL